MRIYSMTATFGKLEHQTLTLEPGLNIIEAPNEWGKSTWCAFIAAMLYGLDTRSKSSKTALADKERFAPWSGTPMSGRMDLRWQGRDITIERHTVRRVPLGAFRAYETRTGIPVPELTAANCGQQLLGVEQSVFRRSAFIRHRDLPVTQDEALRRRLNALVTTGDDSGNADRLAKELKELKNRCRYNRSGLLPQAEEELQDVEEKLRQLEALKTQSRKLKQRLQEQEQLLRNLENHRAALRYTASRADAHRVAQARDAYDQGLEQLTRLEQETASLPSPETARQEANKLRDHIARWNDLQLQLQLLPPPPAEPRENSPFSALSAPQALARAQADAAAWKRAKKNSAALLWLAAGILSFAACAVLFLLAEYLWAAVPGAALIVCAGFWLYQRQKNRKLLSELQSRYGSGSPDSWCTAARAYGEALDACRAQMQAYRTERRELENRLAVLRTQGEELGRGRSPEKALQLYEQALRRWEEYHNALRDQKKLEEHLNTLQSMARTADKPAFRDELTYTEEQTAVLLQDTAAEIQRLRQRLGQYRGQMDAIGEEESLSRRCDVLRQRIARLEDHFAALTIAQETLAQARLTLQRRFAPRIVKRSQELLQRMTGGRYSRLTLGEDFSLGTSAEPEDVLRDAWWRSDGTVDQLYLSLRLAVADELMPHAPLVLDDALVRFDDERLKAVLDILKEEASRKQVILFTCQSREKQLVDGTP